MKRSDKAWWIAASYMFVMFCMIANIPIEQFPLKVGMIVVNVLMWLVAQIHIAKLMIEEREQVKE